MSVRHFRNGAEGGGETKHSSNIFRRHELARTATPATSVGNALRGINIDPKLHQRGIPCYKVCRNGALVERVITLSRSNFIVFVTPQRVWDTTSKTQHTFSSAPFRGRLRRRNKTSKHTSTSGTTSEATATQEEAQQHYTPRYLDICDITRLAAGYISSHKLELCRAKYLGKRQLLSITSLTRNWYKISKAADLVTRNGGNAIVTIVHGANRETLDLIIPDEGDKELFVNALRLIMRTYEDAKENVPCDELLLRYLWHDIDKGKNGTLNKRELWGACRRMNFCEKKKEFSAIYKAFEEKRRAVSDSKWNRFRHHNSGLDFRGCLDFLRTYKSRSDAWDNTFGRDVASVYAEEFLSKFLHGTQCEFDATLDDARNIIARLHSAAIGNFPYKPNEMGEELERHRIDRVLFGIYLHSPLNEACKPECLQFDESCMNESLSEYYINSSHNTYLLGDQVKVRQLATRGITRQY